MRTLPVFSGFLKIAALSDAEIVNFSTIARECGVSSHTVKGYFGILEDTFLGRWLPAYTKRPKRRVIGAPKFYFADAGVVNHLALDHPRIKQRVVVCLEAKSRRTEDGILILPAGDFTERLGAGSLF